MDVSDEKQQFVNTLHGTDTVDGDSRDSQFGHDRYADGGGFESDSEDDILDLDLRQSTPLEELPISHRDTEVLLHDVQYQPKQGLSVLSGNGCCMYFKSPGFLIYCCQALSTWGYRMWTFAISLYLVVIDIGSLRLVAVYGFILCASSLLFGPIIGSWVDKNPRLKVIRLSLLLQNTSLIVSALVLAMLLFLEGNVKLIWNGVLYYIVIFIIIILGDAAELAGQAEKIAIQKDWVVVLAGTNKARLASLNAILLRIDLVNGILAPIFIGWVMAFGSMLAGALVMAGWNLLAGLLEYYLMWKVYSAVPALSVKKKKTFSHEVNGNIADEHEESEMVNPADRMFSVGSDSESSDAEINVSREDLSRGRQQENNAKLHGQDIKLKSIKDERELKKERWQNVRTLFGCCIKFGKGWRTYISYKVCMAGFGSALLYLNVLGFSAVSTGYAYSQGVGAWILGMLLAGGSIAGILGTILFPFLRKKIGLERTGLWAITGEILCLSLCVVSVWAPGSPLDLHHRYPVESNVTDSPLTSTTLLPAEDFTATQANFTTEKLVTPESSLYTTDSYVSITLLFTGIITSRIGLWLFDLTMTQLFQENILETQRGVINGVQNSLNGLMDMLHYILVIIAPHPWTFGLLVLLSFMFVCLGGGLYAVYSYRVRGHLCHFEKCGISRRRGASNGYTQPEVPISGTDV
ncbi:ferroportin-like [Glandiceps talaboti]